MGRESRMPKRMSIFEVLKAMAERKMDVRLAPLANVRRIELVKQGTLITIGVDGDVIFRLHNGMFVGGLLLVDKKQFDEVRAEIEEAKGISGISTIEGGGGDN